MMSYSDYSPLPNVAALLKEAQRRGLKTRAESNECESDWVIDAPTPHTKQRAFIDSPAKRKVIRAGRRGGKTVGVSILAVRAFMAGKRVLYATPTQEQIDSFWWHVTQAFADPIARGILNKNETRHIIELPGTRRRMRAKTAWNADTLRGDYADLLIMDEWQLMNENAWELVGAPMLLDNNGDAVFIYTPPSLRSRSVTKAFDPMHAMKLYKKAAADTTGRWATFNFSSRENPHISVAALNELAGDMTELSIRQEIEAEDIDEAPGALWKRLQLDSLRLTKAPDLFRIVVGVDPSGSATGAEAGIVTVGAGECMCKGHPEVHGFVLTDNSVQASPEGWARAAVTNYNVIKADKMVAEQNFGGEMVATTIHTIPDAPDVELINSSRGKYIRAEPIAALYSQGKMHHVGSFPALESEMCQWTPGDKSPNRLDALVFAFTDLLPQLSRESNAYSEPVYADDYRFSPSDF